VRHLVELFEDAGLLALADADAGVPHLQHHAPVAAPAAHEDAAVVGVADGVRHQVAQDAFDEHRVGIDVVVLAAEAQRQALLECRRLEVEAQLAEDVADVEVLGRDVDAAGVDLGDVEQLGEQALECIHRTVDAGDEAGHLLVMAALAQRLGKKAHRVQRLA
jgi:hypothetical protein